MQTFNFPVGISDFSEIRQNGYYYVDKTGLIAELLNNSAAKFTLITRPPLFGKNPCMSMLASFFNIQKNSDTLFEGLEISKDTASCQKWMNQYPTLFLTFKDVDGLNFDDAYGQLAAQIAPFLGADSQLKTTATTPVRTTESSVPASSKDEAPYCPKCGGVMVLRTAKSGANAGNRFWGCSNYPNCRSMLPYTG